MPMTREVQASEAKTHLPQLLDDIERGDDHHHARWPADRADRARGVAAAARDR